MPKIPPYQHGSPDLHLDEVVIIATANRMFARVVQIKAYVTLEVLKERNCQSGFNEPTEHEREWA